MSSAHFITTEPSGLHSLNLLVEGMHCPSCVAIIENALIKQTAVQNARLNLSTKRLRIAWKGSNILGDKWIEMINGMGYHAVPFDPATAETSEIKEEKFLLRCLAVAGFASGNLMLFSIPLWSSDAVEMGEATRTLFHWMQAAIAIPAIAYCGIPFYRSALKALRALKTNMDVPISVAVILATLMSLFETATGGLYSYFDSGVMLLFFLLIGRYLEARARGRARSAAHDLLQMMTGFATVLHESGAQETIPLSDIKEGMVLMVAAGEKIGADGLVISGTTEIDTSLITGESQPRGAMSGTALFAGTINMAAPITMRVTRAGERSLLSEIVKLMESAEQAQAKYVTLADRISSWYTPAVHALAAATFAGWILWGGIPWQVALLYAATVLIITCPCALGLAVPVVQVLASGKLMRSGILLKSGSALERLATITHAVFDKTGTLTLGKPTLTSSHSQEQLQLAASLSINSKHPLSQALVRACPNITPMMNVREVQGYGLEAAGVKLGKRSWATNLTDDSDNTLELWLAEERKHYVRFTFADELRADAKEVIDALQSFGIKTLLLSGDRIEVTKNIAEKLGITAFEGALTPVEKTQRIAALKAHGANVLMVGDGLNDAPSLSSATVSMSPATAMDITQSAADIVFQGNTLQPVLTALNTAKLSQILVKQNFLLAIGYNVIAIPLAVAGYVTPLIAAIAMSSSSLLVIANAMRLNARRL
ncbi:MAG: cadmium-translocating P-type ATPase [Rickettsiales bacterium]|jgi:Cu2+-exporting ATPase|nr:cadmium-translocating P-type ATPase [Rickettsiales bacterium]